MSGRRIHDFLVAVKSDQPTLSRYRDIRTDRRLLEELIYDGW